MARVETVPAEGYATKKEAIQSVLCPECGAVAWQRCIDPAWGRHPESLRTIHRVPGRIHAARAQVVMPLLTFLMSRDGVT